MVGNYTLRPVEAIFKILLILELELESGIWCMDSWDHVLLESGQWVMNILP